MCSLITNVLLSLRFVLLATIVSIIHLDFKKSTETSCKHMTVYRVVRQLVARSFSVGRPYKVTILLGHTSSKNPAKHLACLIAGHKALLHPTQCLANCRHIVRTAT